MYNPFKLNLNSILLIKFGSTLEKPDSNEVLDILPQMLEINLYESIFETIVSGNIVIDDMIGLFVNFPLTGEELVEINYSNPETNVEYKKLFIIESISDIVAEDDGRGLKYIINIKSVEAYANSKRVISQAYHGDVSDMVQDILKEYIFDVTKDVFPQYKIPDTFFEADSGLQDRTLIIPMLNPFSSFDWLSDFAISTIEKNPTYLFYQTLAGFNFSTIQSKFQLLDDPSFRKTLTDNRYVYYANDLGKNNKEIDDRVRIITDLNFNNRNSSIQKISSGYFENNLYEINMFQKSYNITPTKIESFNSIEKNSLNTKAFIEKAPVDDENAETANYTKYVISNHRENDEQYPISQEREKFGKNLAALTALSQIDLYISIPGDLNVNAGQLIYVEIPEYHSFNNIKEDDLVSGYYLITEIKHVFKQGDFYATVLRINKDSYNTSIDRESRYK